MRGRPWAGAAVVVTADQNPFSGHNTHPTTVRAGRWLAGGGDFSAEERRKPR